MEQRIDHLDTQFDIFVESLLEKHHVPGVSIAIVDADRILTKAYGFAKLPDVPATTGTLYYTGSTTKAMVAAAVGRLINDEWQPQDKGNESLKLLRKTKWATPIKAILPEDFVLESSEAMSDVTVEDVLSHRTGLSGADNLYGKWMGSEVKSVVRALRHLGPPNKSFRTTWQYNNLMYSVVGHLLEKATDLHWGEALRQILWQPIGMPSTFWHADEIAEGSRHSIAQGYFWSEASAEEAHYVAEPFLEFAGIGPAGSVISNVEDYAKYMQALLAAGNPSSDSQDDSDLCMSPATFADLTTPRIFHPMPQSMNKNSFTTPRSYSLGWFNFVTTAGIEHPIIAHGGGLNGFGTQLYLMPNDRFGVVTMANTVFSGNHVGQAISTELMARRLGLGNTIKSAFINSLDEFGAIEKLISSAEQAMAALPAPTFVDDQSDQNTAILASLEDMLGTYHHPAYGSLQISRSGSCTASKVDSYGLQVLRRDRTLLDASRQHALVLRMSGERMWPNHFLLHPRLQDVDTQKNENYTQKKLESIFLDLEVITSHGLGEAESNNVERSTTVKESVRVCRQGAAFRMPNTLGLRLANEYLNSPGRDQDGWESEMTWFRKLQ